MADELRLKMPECHVTFRDVLIAVNLRHGTNDITACLGCFRPEKIRRLRPGLDL